MTRCIALTLCALFFAGAPAHTQGVGVIVDYATPPAATEAELFNRAVVVLRGRVEARRVDTTPGNPLSSVYTVRIMELLKSDGRVSLDRFIEVRRHGGFEERSRDVGFAAFEVKDEVVLFLERGRNGWYWPLNGPDGAFKLTTDGRTHAYGTWGAVSKRHAGRSSSEFMAELRKHKK